MSLSANLDELLEALLRRLVSRALGVALRRVLVERVLEDLGHGDVVQTVPQALDGLLELALAEQLVGDVVAVVDVDPLDEFRHTLGRLRPAFDEPSGIVEHLLQIAPGLGADPKDGARQLLLVDDVEALDRIEPGGVRIEIAHHRDDGLDPDARRYLGQRLVERVGADSCRCIFH